MASINNSLIDVNEILDKLNDLSLELQKIEANSSKSLNIFNAIGMDTQEVKHSHFLAWLFNITEKHGLDNLFFRGFLEKLIHKQKNNDATYPILSNEEIIDKTFPNRSDYINLVNGKEVSVMTERVSDANNSRTDIVIKLEDKQALIVIENKTLSTLHDEQLAKYEQEYSRSKYLNWAKLFVYLTPKGNNPIESNTYFNKWCICSYEDINDILVEILKNKKLSKRLKFMLEDYIEMVKTNILLDNKKIRDACKDIYAKHREALEILYNYTDNTKDIMAFCKEYLKKNDFIDIINKSDSKTQFYFLSRAMFNTLGGKTLNNASEVKFSYRITKEHDFFEKLVFFKKDKTSNWEQWQWDFLLKISPSSKFGSGSENSQSRASIVDIDIVHGSFDNVAKEALASRLDSFISEIEEFERK